jgi:hypothetical protein
MTYNPRERTLARDSEVTEALMSEVLNRRTNALNGTMVISEVSEVGRTESSDILRSVL